jgi:hypothetical protein
MTYHELVKKVQLALAKADASKIEEHIAVQVNVTGEAEGAFYMEVANGSLFVCPYDYNDRDALLTVSGDDILAVAEGKLTLENAYEQSRLLVELSHDDSLSKLLVLGGIIPVKKAVKKKAEEEVKAEAAPAETAETEAPAAEAAPAEAAPAAPAKRGRKPSTEKKPVASKKTTAKKKKTK